MTHGVALCGGLFLAFTVAAGTALAQQQQGGTDRQAMIDEALSAAPPQVARTATVKDLQGNTLREGSGSYTCFPAPDGIAGPMCMDETWLGWMDAWMKQQPFQAPRVGLAYMLAGDAPQGGASNSDPTATGPDADNEWVVEGPHVMILVPAEAMLQGLPTTPVDDGPYVMWSGTPYAHVMMPIDERGEQRTAGK